MENKSKTHIGFTLMTVLLLLGAWYSVAAQTLTEQLQKQVWPGMSPTSPDDWETLLPVAGQDTLTYTGSGQAEVISLNAAGYPNAITVLQQTAQGWAPQTQTIATFDARGYLTVLHSMIWENGHWQNEAQTLRTLDPNGNDQSFELYQWEDGGWSLAYQKVNPGASSPKAKPAPNISLARTVMASSVMYLR